MKKRKVGSFFSFNFFCKDVLFYMTQFLDGDSLLCLFHTEKFLYEHPNFANLMQEKFYLSIPPLATEYPRLPSTSWLRSAKYITYEGNNHLMMCEMHKFVNSKNVVYMSLPLFDEPIYFLSSYVNLQYLFLPNFTGYANPIVHLTKLKVLSLFKYQRHDLSFLKNCPNLETLHLDNLADYSNFQYGRTRIVHFDVFLKLKRLKYISVPQMIGSVDKFVNCTSLEELVLPNIHLNKDDWKLRLTKLREKINEEDQSGG